MRYRRSLFAALVTCLVLSAGSSAGPPGNRDGQDNVDGATWRVEAVNTKNGKKEQFRFRAKNGKLFNFTGEVVGGVRFIAATERGGRRAEMHWREPLPLEGEISIVLAKKGLWGGTLKTKAGEEWRCRMEVADR